ncbi:MAG: manganese efflux pump [Clostridia bacterium]|nr:manganese efflux pump [Clostridia bacterium]
MFSVEFFIRSALLGVGLAMDACAVSMANGFSEPKMRLGKQAGIAGAFGFFQAAMPIAGFFIGVAVLAVIEKIIPYLALIMLGYIGGKMIIGAIKEKEAEKGAAITFGTLMLQSLATSIDALSVGFTMADSSIAEAFVMAGIIAVITFIIAFCGVEAGKRLGTKLGKKAELLGGIILIGIGIEIFIKGII